MSEFALPRREALKAGVGLVSITAMAQPMAATWTAQTLDEHQLATVEVLGDLIIPTTDTPGAKAALVHRYVDLFLTDGPDSERVRFLEGLGWLDGYTNGKFQKPFIQLSDDEKRGFELFTGKARCTSCHSVGERDALFTDHGFHNTGIGWARTFQAPERTRVELAPGVHAEIDRRTLQTFAEPPAPDVGRYEITRDPKDRWAYKTPSLRNVALTAPYMHDGSLATLEAVIEFYDGGGIDNPQKSTLIRPLGLTAEERAALAAFLRTLTGSTVAALVADARRIPIGR